MRRDDTKTMSKKKNWICYHLREEKEEDQKAEMDRQCQPRRELSGRQKMKSVRELPTGNVCPSQWLKEVGIPLSSTTLL